MTDFFERLLLRGWGRLPTVRPRGRGRFEDALPHLLEMSPSSTFDNREALESEPGDGGDSVLSRAARPRSPVVPGSPVLEPMLETSLIGAQDAVSAVTRSRIADAGSTSAPIEPAKHGASPGLSPSSTRLDSAPGVEPLPWEGGIDTPALTGARLVLPAEAPPPLAEAPAEEEASRDRVDVVSSLARTLSARVGPATTSALTAAASRDAAAASRDAVLAFAGGETEPRRREDERKLERPAITGFAALARGDAAAQAPAAAVDTLRPRPTPSAPSEMRRGGLPLPVAALPLSAAALPLLGAEPPLLVADPPSAAPLPARSAGKQHRAAARVAAPTDVTTSQPLLADHANARSVLPEQPEDPSRAAVRVRAESALQAPFSEPSARRAAHGTPTRSTLESARDAAAIDAAGSQASLPGGSLTMPSVALPSTVLSPRPRASTKPEPIVAHETGGIASVRDGAEVRISIGTVELRAVKAVPPPAPIRASQQQPLPALSLDECLAVWDRRRG